ncbi:MAG: hypothetical protein V3V02_12365 [Rhizobiaceae bacterium]
MYVSTAQLNFDQPLFNPLATTAGFKEPASAYEVVASRMIRSVVEEAGLGGFVYLQGFSGKRYVFSAIRPEQVALYDNALFAVSEPGGECVRVGQELNNLNHRACLLYVHLLDDDVSNGKEVLADLSGAH